MGEGEQASGHVLFEGRDAAGQGRHDQGNHREVSPRVFRVVALPSPSDRENRSYPPALHAAFPRRRRDRHFRPQLVYRAGVEYVMGFCTPAEHKRFLSLCPQMEQYIIDGGIILIKLWLEVGMDEQERRLRRGSRIRCGSGS